MAIPPRSRTLAEIKAKLLNPATTSHFQVNIGKPTDDGSFQKFLSETGAFNDQDRLNLLCCESSLPGSSFATTEVTNDFSGVTERHVNRRIYDQRTDFTFYTDAEQYLPIRFFEAWMNYITNESVSPGRTGSVKDPNFFYRMKFPNSYKGSLEITKFEKNLEERKSAKALTYSFVNAFPLAINSTPVSYESSSLLKCTVSFTYSRYYIDSGGKGLGGFGNPLQQAFLNGQLLSPGGIPSLISGAAGNAIGNTLGNQRLGSLAGGFIRNLF